MHTVKGFSIVDETEVDVFLEFLGFLFNPTDVANLISGSSAFSISSLYIWKFLVHIKLKPSLRILSIIRLDLVDRVPEELWTEVHNIVQEVVTKTIPKKKKCKKAKWWSEEALQKGEERREAKGKGERERYTQLNEDFQTIARRDKKAFK